MFASADIAGTCLATVTAPLWLAPIGPRRGSSAGLITIIAANILCIYSPATWSLLITRFIAGIGAGMVYSSCIPVIAKSNRPARLVSVLQVLQLLMGGASMVAAGWLLKWGGTPPVLLAIIGLSALSLPTALWLPMNTGTSRGELPSLGKMRPALVILAAILIYFASVGILTNYAGKLGTQHMLSIATISSVLAIGNLGALPGSLIAALAEKPVIRNRLLALATIFQVAVVIAMLTNSGLIIFAVGFFFLQFCITIMAPLQVAALVDHDSSGRAIEGLAATQSLGQAFGPLIASLFISVSSMDGAYVFGLICCALSGMVFIWLASRRSAVAPC